jgi:hypothetical protein
LRMNFLSFAFTSCFVAICDSHRISFRTVRSRHCSGVKSASMSRLLALPK